MNDGHKIPQLGFGVYKIPDSQAADAVGYALECGYRHIDTAALYKNEHGVGEGLARSDIARDEVFVTTKVWNDDQGYDTTLRAFDASLERLGLEYVDLYLVHWPAPQRGLYIDTYKALETIREQGRARSIGVCNFTISHLKHLLANTSVTPVINQIELHPWLPQIEVRTFNAANGILTEAWSPLARGRVLDNETLASIAMKHNTTPARIVLRWQLDLGNVVIPKSITPHRIRENIDVFNFTLDGDDHAQIATLATGQRTGANPDDLN